LGRILYLKYQKKKRPEGWIPKPGESREPKPVMAFPKKDGRVRHWREIDEQLKPVKEPFYLGCPVYITGGIHEGVKATIELKQGFNAIVVLPSEEKVVVGLNFLKQIDSDDDDDDDDIPPPTETKQNRTKTKENRDPKNDRKNKKKVKTKTKNDIKNKKENPPLIPLIVLPNDPVIRPENQIHLQNPHGSHKTYVSKSVVNLNGKDGIIVNMLGLWILCRTIDVWFRWRILGHCWKR